MQFVTVPLRMESKSWGNGKSSSKDGESKAVSSKLPSFRERLAMGFGGPSPRRETKSTTEKKKPQRSIEQESSSESSARSSVVAAPGLPSSSLLRKFLDDAHGRRGCFQSLDGELIKKDSLRAWLEQSGVCDSKKALNLLVKVKNTCLIHVLLSPQ